MNYLEWEQKWMGVVGSLESANMTDEQKMEAVLVLGRYEPWRQKPEDFARGATELFATEARRVATLAQQKFALWAITIPTEAEQYVSMLAFSGYHARVSTRSAYKEFIFVRVGPGQKEIERGKIIENWRQGGMDYACIINTDWMYCDQAEWHRRMGGASPVTENSK